MSKNNGNGKDLRNGMLLDLNGKFAEMMEKLGEISGEIKAVRVEFGEQKKNIDETDTKINNHLKKHQEGDNSIIWPIVKGIGMKKWIVFVFGLCLADIAIAFLMLKFGPEKIISYIVK